MLFDPTQHTDTPARLTDKDVHAVIVRADYRDTINTPNVQNGKGLQVYFGIVEEGARGIVLEKTFFIEGTSNDQAARNVLADVCRTVGHNEPLSADNIEAWCSGIATDTTPVKLVTRPDPKNPKYRRLQYVNQPTAYADARKLYSEQIEEMRLLAAKNSERLSLSSGGSEDVAV